MRCRRVASDDNPGGSLPARRLFAPSSEASPPHDDMIDLTADSDSQQQEAGNNALQPAASGVHSMHTADAATSAAAHTDTLPMCHAPSNSGIGSGAAVPGGSPAVEDSPAIVLIGVSPAAGAIAHGGAATPTRPAGGEQAGDASADVPPAAGSSAAGALAAADIGDCARPEPARSDALPDEAFPQTPLQRQRMQQQQADAERGSQSLPGQQAQQASLLQEFSQAEQQFVQHCDRLQVSRQQR